MTAHPARRLLTGTLTCPTCGLTAPIVEFNPSLSDECFCPAGCEWFLIDTEGDDDDE